MTNLIGVLRWIAIVMDIVLLVITVFFGSKVEDKASRIGFSLMELAYFLSITVMLWQAMI